MVRFRGKQGKINLIQAQNQRNTVSDLQVGVALNPAEFAVEL
jgi:hypothetical protein